MTDIFETEVEAPEALERRADDIYAGDEIFTPAGRWETVTEVVNETWRVVLRTTTGRKSFTWRFNSYVTLPVLREWHRPEDVAVRLWEARGGDLREVLAAVADRSTSAAVINGHHLAQAQWSGRGCGWAVWDLVADAAVALGVSKAEAVAEVKRLARQYAKDLGLPCETGKAVNR